ncbi:MAG: hypothetical protein M1835_004003 [Candelina submexicana]|nr:MAG: hypothetical protein M1835_004003 [Candelina submexicana]
MLTTRLKPRVIKFHIPLRFTLNQTRQHNNNNKNLNNLKQKNQTQSPTYLPNAFLALIHGCHACLLAESIMPLQLNETQSLAHIGASMVHGGFIVLHSRTEGHGAEKTAFLGLVVLLLARFAFRVDAVAVGAGVGVRYQEEEGEEKGEIVEGGEHGDN